MMVETSAILSIEIMLPLLFSSPCLTDLSYTAVVVGGLPENATGQLIVEVLGEVAPIRKRNFCHV